MAIFFLADRRFKTDRLLADLDDLAHLFRADLHLLCDFLGRGFTTKVLEQTTADTDQAIDRLHHMHWNANRSSLVSNSTRNRLTNPPCRIRAEFVAFRVIEFLDSTNQADVSLLDQIQKAHTAANILFSNAYDKTQVRLG